MAHKAHKSLKHPLNTPAISLLSAFQHCAASRIIQTSLEVATLVCTCCPSSDARCEVTWKQQRQQQVGAAAARQAAGRRRGRKSPPAGQRGVNARRHTSHLLGTVGSTQADTHPTRWAAWGQRTQTHIPPAGQRGLNTHRHIPPARQCGVKYKRTPHLRGSVGSNMNAHPTCEAVWGQT